VAGNLVAAGRPLDEATAAGQLWEAHYNALARTFGGAVGSPEDIYRIYGADIVGKEKGGPRGAASGQVRVDDRIMAQSGGNRLVTPSGRRPVITLFRQADPSTVIHETGHVWLREILDLSKRDDAPEQLQADARTIRDWMGVGKDGKIMPRHEEKFANGFEQYLNEGHAPSQKLAGVFAKFKQWIGDVYRALAKTGQPINDQIRGVFDRMLASPDGAVTAADREPLENVRPIYEVSARATGDIAAIHEQDAAETPPDRAGAVADQVRMERDQAAATHAPEVVNALTDAAERSRNGTESGASADGGSPGEATGGTAERDTAKSGAIDAGGNRLAPEGYRAPRSGPSGTDLIEDKAGNIRLELLNATENVKVGLRELARQNGDFLDARRGTVPDATRLQLAQIVNATDADINIMKLRQSALEDGVSPSTRLQAARLWIPQATQAWLDAVAKAELTGKAEDLLAQTQARLRLDMIAETLAGATAEWGRSGRALQDIRRLMADVNDGARSIGSVLKEATGRTLFQIRKEGELAAQAAKSGGTATKEGVPSATSVGRVAKMARDAHKPDFWDKISELQVNWLISNPVTHFTYAVGGELLTLSKAIPETIARVAISKALGDESSYWGEVGAGIYALGRGTKLGLIAAGKALWNGDPVKLPGEETVSYALPGHGEGAFKGKFGEVIRSPGRVVSAVHAVQRFQNYSMEISQAAYRVAAQEVRSGALRRADMAGRVASLTMSPTNEMMEYARDQATASALMGRGGEFSQAVVRLSNARLVGTKIPKLIIPFARLPANILEQGLLERTPLGLLAPDILANIRSGDALTRDTQIARIAVGSAIGGMGVYLAANGDMTGAAPADPKERAAWRALGKQEYSIKVGNTWYAYNRLGVISKPLGMAADLWQVGEQLESHGISQVAAAIGISISRLFLDESSMKGLSDALDAAENPKTAGVKWAHDFVSSLVVPFSQATAMVAHHVDPYEREARTTLDAIKAKIPWLSESLAPRVDVFGQLVPQRSTLGDAGITAIYTSRETNDPTIKKLAAMQQAGLPVWPSMPERQIKNVALTDEQYTAYAQLSGRAMKKQLDALVNTPGFDRVPPGVQVQAIHENIEAARERARSLMQMQYPDLFQKALQQQRAIMMTGKKQQ
jgi:hypothetical protein